MQKRTLGRTGYKASVITLGGCGPGYVDQKEADKFIKLALDNEINLVDIAPSYGEAEFRFHNTITKHRNKFFLADKTMERTKEGAYKELQNSLAVTGTEVFDNYQFHAVGTQEELDQIFAKGGAMETFQEARDTGIIKNIGITGHANIELFIQALDRFDFDTVLFPVNVSAMTNPHPHNDFRPLLKKAIEQDVGVVAIKSILKRRWVNEKKYNTWYEPVTTQEDIDKSVWYTLSQEGVTTIPLPCDVRLWEKVIDAGKRYSQLSRSEMDEIEEWAKMNGNSPLFPEFEK